MILIFQNLGKDMDKPVIDELAAKVKSGAKAFLIEELNSWNSFKSNDFETI